MSDHGDNVDPGGGADPGGTSIPPMPPEQASDQPALKLPRAEPTPTGAAQLSLWERAKKMLGG